MLEYFAYKKFKKNKVEKEAKAKDKDGKTTDVKPENKATPSSPAIATPSSPSATPLLDDDDERFLERLTASSHHDDDDEGFRPALPPRVKTPDLTWDSDTESFRREEQPGTTADKKGKKANRLSLLLRRHKKPDLSPAKAGNSTSLTVPTPETDRERDDLTRVLDDLNLSARNNKAFSLSDESAELLRRFNLVLRDLVNGVPTAVDDLTKLLDDPDGALAKNYEKLPRSLKKLVTQLPEKLSSTLAPELLAVAAEAQGLGKNGLGGDAAGDGIKGAAKRLLVPKNLKELITKPGAVVSMLKAIMNALKVRWPAFMGTNVIWSLALFLLLFVLWYCHKRGREVRLEKEKSEAGGVVDGSSRIEELPDDPTLPAPPPRQTTAGVTTKATPALAEPVRR